MTFDSVVVLDSNDVIKKAGESKLNFNTLFQVPAENVHQAIEMAQVFQDAINGDTLEFNFDQALQLVKEHKEMAVTGTINQSIVKQDNQVSAMVDDVMNLLDTVVGVYLDKETPTYEKFKNTIEQGFTNLNEQKKKVLGFSGVRKASTRPPTPTTSYSLWPIKIQARLWQPLQLA